MCLGAQAAAANETARRNYAYQIQKREQKWMQDRSLTQVEHVQHQQLMNNTNLGLANVYADIHAQHKELLRTAVQNDEDRWRKFLADSGTIAAKGVTGKSADRIQTLDLAKYLSERSRANRDVSQQATELVKEGRKAAGATRSAQLQSFAKQAFFKTPDIAPPVPVMQNVGQAAFMDALNIGMTVAGPFIAKSSDRNLKENIKKIGESISGLGIYKFNYIGQTQKWIGTMADEVKKIKPEAVVLMKNGFQGVRYDMIDVNMRRAV